MTNAELSCGETGVFPNDKRDCHTDATMLTLRPGQRILNIPGIGVQTSRRAVSSAGNGLLNNLVAYWPLNEASGDALDAHTNGLTLTDMLTVTSAVGKVYATARKYTSANGEYHAHLDNALLSTGDVDYTIAAWVWLDGYGIGFPGIVGKDVAGAREFFLVVYSSDYKPHFRAMNGTSSVGEVIGGNILNLSTWYFVVAWHDSAANTVSISIDNGVTASQETTGAPADTATPFTIGSYYDYASARSWDGRIGPVAFWKSAAGAGGVLTAEQRATLWNAGAGLAYSAFTT